MYAIIRNLDIFSQMIEITNKYDHDKIHKYVTWIDTDVHKNNK